MSASPSEPYPNLKLITRTGLRERSRFLPKSDSNHSWSTRSENTICQNCLLFISASPSNKRRSGSDALYASPPSETYCIPFGILKCCWSRHALNVPTVVLGHTNLCDMVPRNAGEHGFDLLCRGHANVQNPSMLVGNATQKGIVLRKKMCRNGYECNNCSVHRSCIMRCKRL